MLLLLGEAVIFVAYSVSCHILIAWTEGYIISCAYETFGELDLSLSHPKTQRYFSVLCELMLIKKL